MSTTQDITHQESSHSCIYQLTPEDFFQECVDFKTALTKGHLECINHEDVYEALKSAITKCDKQMVIKILESKLLSCEDITRIHLTTLCSSFEISEIVSGYTDLKKTISEEAFLSFKTKIEEAFGLGQDS